MEGLNIQPNRRESAELTDDEKVLSQVEHNISGIALERWMAMKVGGQPHESFVQWIEDFNATSAEERGKDKYDHNRPLTEHKDISIARTSPSGYEYDITLHKNGEITLSLPSAN